MKQRKVGRKVAAGSLAAALVVAALAPLNMGGCGDVGQAVSGAVSSVGKAGSSLASGLGSGGSSGGSTNKFAQGVGIAQGATEALEGLNLSEEKERALGECVALSGANQYGIVNNDALNRYVTMVAQTLADVTPVGGRPVAFVINTDQINAYSGPTGYIMITRGLLNRLDDESELAGVLGHEMGHVVEHHGLDAASKSQVGSGAIKAIAAGTGKDAAVVNLGGELVKAVFGTPFNQGQENQADADAVKFMTAAGYDAQGYVRALQKLQAAGSTSSGVMSTHPNIADRIASVRSAISQPGGQTNRERFQAIVRGGGANPQ